MRHGDPSAPLTFAQEMYYWLTRSEPDPRLALVHADMDAWAEAHPCNCEALCECEETN